jgi:hypothetical protein
MGGESGCAFFLLRFESTQAYDFGAHTLPTGDDVFPIAHNAWKPRGSLDGGPVSAVKILSGHYG